MATSRDAAKSTVCANCPLIFAGHTSSKNQILPCKPDKYQGDSVAVQEAQISFQYGIVNGKRSHGRGPQASPRIRKGSCASGSEHDRAVVEAAAGYLSSEESDIGYLFSGCAAALPHRRLPDDAPWQVTTDRVTLIIQPGLRPAPGDMPISVGVPYGSRPPDPPLPSD